jgi:hypothetical protein
MNLMYPKKWNGPYLGDNPTLQDTYYIVARLADGYYIMPGIGVTLSDDRVIGTDVIVSSDVSGQSLEGLQDKKKSLIAKISVTGDRD